MYWAVVEDTGVGANVQRMRILARLRNGEQNVCARSDAFQTGQSRLSFHLRVLKDAGLVTHRPEERSIYYMLNHHALQEAEALLAHLKQPGASASRTVSRASRWSEAGTHHNAADAPQRIQHRLGLFHSERCRLRSPRPAYRTKSKTGY